MGAFRVSRPSCASQGPTVTEAEYQRFILDYARALGWHRMHTRAVPVKQRNGIRHITPLSGEEGFVDLVLARKGRIAFLELKSEKGRPTDQQVDWLNALSGQRDPIEKWRSRDEVPNGQAFHANGGWCDVSMAGDWTVLVALVRPRHKEWVMEVLR